MCLWFILKKAHSWFVFQFVLPETELFLLQPVMQYNIPNHSDSDVIHENVSIS